MKRLFLSTLTPGRVAMLGLLAFTSCEAEVKQDRFGRTAEPGPQAEPLTLKEVSFHVRMRLPDSELLSQATKRGLVLDGEPKVALANLQASPDLIAKLTAPDILLTKAERKLYDARVAARGSRLATDAAAADQFLDQRKGALNQSLADQERIRIQRQIAELTEKANKIRTEQSREKYSVSSDSPYQRRQAEINQITREISALRK
jgi:hypothetical protein